MEHITSQIVWGILHQWGKFIKMWFIDLLHFFGTFLLFFVIKFVSLSFSFLFSRSVKFPQQNINQSELWIGDFQLSVEMCVNCSTIIPICVIMWSRAQSKLMAYHRLAWTVGRGYFVWSRLWSLKISFKLKYPSPRLHQTSLRQNKSANIKPNIVKNISK